jgi:hypothetical protein
MTQLVALLSNRKTQIVSVLILLNGLYMILFGEQVPTWESPGAADQVQEGLGWVASGSGLSTARMGISKLQAALSRVETMLKATGVEAPK